jgi:hypothetical protein
MELIGAPFQALVPEIAAIPADRRGFAPIPARFAASKLGHAVCTMPISGDVRIARSFEPPASDATRDYGERGEVVADQLSEVLGAQFAADKRGRTPRPRERHVRSAHRRTGIA